MNTYVEHNSSDRYFIIQYKLWQREILILSTMQAHLLSTKWTLKQPEIYEIEVVRIYI